MKVFIGFLLAIFLVTARREARGSSLRLRWLMLFTVAVAASFYSLRVIE